MSWIGVPGLRAPCSAARAPLPSLRARHGFARQTTCAGFVPHSHRLSAGRRLRLISRVEGLASRSGAHLVPARFHRPRRAPATHANVLSSGATIPARPAAPRWSCCRWSWRPAPSRPSITGPGGLERRAPRGVRRRRSGPIVARISPCPYTECRARRVSRCASTWSGRHSHWVAITCSTSLVPIPKASRRTRRGWRCGFPAQTIVHARAVYGQLGPDDVDDALVLGAERVIGPALVVSFGPRASHLPARQGSHDALRRRRAAFERWWSAWQACGRFARTGRPRSAARRRGLRADPVD